MKLLIIVLCLLSERFLIHTVSYKRFDWINRYTAFIDQLINKNSGTSHSALLLTLYVAPLILIAGLVYFSLYSFLFGLLGLLLNLVLFYYCLGPQNPFYPEISPNEDSLPHASVSDYLAAVNNQLFSVIFWYVVGGPIVVLLFRLISLFQNHIKTAELAKDITEVLEWIPARMTAVLYLLVGNFQAGLKPLLTYLIAKPVFNQKMLSECGILALKSDDSAMLPLPVAQTLVEHAVIVLLVLVALFTLAAWL